MSKLCKETMINSYQRISFYGEKRGAQDFEYYSALLESDLNTLKGRESIMETTLESYKEKFISKVMDIFHRQSSCTSAFIVGPANYNIRQHEKKWASRDNAYSHFEHWRSKYFKAVNRVRTPSPEDEIESAVKDIDKLLRFQAVMKETNKLMRKYKLDRDYMVGFEKSDNEKALSAELLDLYSYDECPDSRVNSILKADCYGNRGYASFELTSINNKIKARRDKITINKARIERKETFKPLKFEGGSIYIENDRVIIAHDEKPEREVIQAIKSNGFRWSPKMGNWCRKHTGNAIYSATYLLNNVFGGEVAQ